MSKHHRGRVRRAAAWTASIALVAGTVAGVVSATASSAAAKHHQGALQLCLGKTRAHSHIFTVSRKGFSKTIRLHPSAHHAMCAASIHMKAGKYRISEKVKTGEHVSNIKVSPRHSSVRRNVFTANAHIRLSAHTTTHVTYYNHKAKKTPTPKRDPGTGYLEVCKYAMPHDPWMPSSGEVTVSIASGDFRDSEVIPFGQCTDPIQVPAGNVAITETKMTAPQYLAKVYTNPSTALVSVNSNTNRTVVRVKASSDQSVETTAALFNATATGYVKICKTLGSHASGLLGSTFNYNTSYELPGSSSWVPWFDVSVTVPADGALGKTYCKLIWQPLPLGTVVQATEQPQSGALLTGVSIEPASQDAGSTSSVALMTVGPNRAGTVTAVFTNDGVGTVEICKNVSDPVYNGIIFTFTINGTKTVHVPAGDCSAPISVTAGTATVAEVLDPDFNLASMTATGPDGENRILSGTNPITVSVPSGGAGNETLVTATNDPKTSVLKVCKISNYKVQMGTDPDAPYVSYNFYVTFSTMGESYTVTLTPESTGPDGEVCGSLSAPLPVITDAARDRISVTVTEGPSPWGTGQITVEPDVITYDGNGTVNWVNEWSTSNPNDDGNYGLSAVLGRGVNIVTFTNDLVDPKPAS